MLILNGFDPLARRYGASGYYYDSAGFVGFQAGEWIDWYRWTLPGENGYHGPAGYVKTGETLTARGATFRRI